MNEAVALGVSKDLKRLWSYESPQSLLSLGIPALSYCHGAASRHEIMLTYLAKFDRIAFTEVNLKSGKRRGRNESCNRKRSVSRPRKTIGPEEVYQLCGKSFFFWAGYFQHFGFKHFHGSRYREDLHSLLYLRCKRSIIQVFWTEKDFTEWGPMQSSCALLWVQYSVYGQWRFG